RARSRSPGSAGRRASAGICRRRPCAGTGRPPAARRQWSRGILLDAGLAPAALVLLGYRSGIGVVDDAALARERQKSLALCAADQREPGAAREIDAPGGESRARYQ